MSSRFAKQYAIPPEFPDVLKEFTRAVLKDQPKGTLGIHEFAAKYFDCLANGMHPGADVTGAPPPAGGAMDMNEDEMDSTIRELFSRYDKDGNGFLDPAEFQAIMENLRRRIDFPADEVVRFLAEADINDDGKIYYSEFIGLAVQILQSIFAKKHFEQKLSEIHADADMLVHGMSRHELTETIAYIFERMDENQRGTLTRAEFVSALQSMELGLTRREVNTIMFKVVQDSNGNIDYRQFTPLAFDLLLKLASLHLLEAELESDDMGKFLIGMCKDKDEEMSGMLHVEDVGNLLHDAQLGLTRMQIFTVMSEAEVTPENFIAYARFVPRAVSLIRSMLLFENSVAKESAEMTPEEEDVFYMRMEDVFQGQDVVQLEDFLHGVGEAEVINPDELKAVKNMLVITSGDGESISVEEATGQVWVLIKTMRRSKFN